MATLKDRTFSPAVHATDESKPDAWETAGELAAKVLQDAPSVASLGQMLARSEQAYQAFDVASLALLEVKGSKHDKEQIACADAQALLYERQDALRVLISTQPARTLGDAAVQIAEIGHLADQLHVNDYDEITQIALTKRIERMALSMLPVLAEAAGLDMQAMNWARQDEYLRPSRWAGVGVKA